MAITSTITACRGVEAERAQARSRLCFMADTRVLPSNRPPHPALAELPGGWYPNAAGVIRHVSAHGDHGTLEPASLHQYILTAEDVATAAKAHPNWRRVPVFL